jgi:hypothetical protein
MRSYLTIFGGITAITLGAAATLNYVVDPYLIHQWDTPQVWRLRPVSEKLSSWGKTYAVARFQPGVVYVGSSRTEAGLPVRTPLFVGKDVFNGGLSGATVGDAMSMVRHASAVGRLDTVVWGIDASMFSLEGGNSNFDPELVASDRYYLWRRSLIDIKRALTIDMTLDSISLLRGTFGHSCLSSLATYGQRDEGCIRYSLDHRGGTEAAIRPRLREYIRGAGPTVEAMHGFGQAIAGLCRAGTRVRVYINPTHAMTSDGLYWSGKWPAMERWQAALAELGRQQRLQGCNVRLYDFSGFNSITTEAIPQVSSKPDMQYYWETSHYRVNVGRMILARMFDRDEGVPGDFGVELTPSTLAQHQSAQRAQRDRYHQLHAAETSMVLEVVAELGYISTEQPFSHVRAD